MKVNSRAGSLPGPGDGIQVVGIADCYWLHRYPRIEAARLKGDEAGPVGACPLRKYENLKILMLY